MLLMVLETWQLLSTRPDTFEREILDILGLDDPLQPIREENHKKKTTAENSATLYMRKLYSKFEAQTERFGFLF